MQALSFSFQNILKVDNLDGLFSLVKLQLDNNIIEKIENISHLTNLEWLDLSFNNIQHIEGLDTLVKLTDLRYVRCLAAADFPQTYFFLTRMLPQPVQQSHRQAPKSRYSHRTELSFCRKQFHYGRGRSNPIPAALSKLENAQHAGEPVQQRP